MDLGKPLLSDVLKGCWRGDGETNQEDISLGVRKGTEPIIVLLPCSIEESQSVWLISDHHGDGVIIEDGGDVFRRKFVRSVADEKAGFAYRTVTHDDTLDRSDRHFCYGQYNLVAVAFPEVDDSPNSEPKAISKASRTYA